MLTSIMNTPTPKFWGIQQPQTLPSLGNLIFKTQACCRMEGEQNRISQGISDQAGSDRHHIYSESCYRVLILFTAAGICDLSLYSGLMSTLYFAWALKKYTKMLLRNSRGQWFSSRRRLLPSRGHLATSGNISDCHDLRSTLGIKWMKTRAASKHPRTHKNYVSRNIKSAEI